MDVSIIIVNYNTFYLTSRCIRSVYRYTSGLDFEVILVDNRSAECDADLFKKEFPGITLIKNLENLGFAKGNNMGIEVSKGDAILLLNSDTELIENSVLMCYEKLKLLSTETAIITCKLIYPDGLVQRQCSCFPGIANNLLELTRLHKLFSRQKRAKIMLGFYFNHETDIMPDWVWGTFFMFKRDVIKSLPGKKLNEKYFMYCEDMKWCYDFWKIGKTIYYYAGTKVIHLVGQSVSESIFKIDSIIKNEMDFVAETHNRIYAFFYSIVKSLNVLFSSSRSNRIMYCKTYLKYAISK